MTQTNLPILYLRDVVLLPFNDIRLEFSNDIDKKILNIAESNYDGYVLLINLNDPLEEEPDYNTLPDIGILGKIKSKIDLPNGITRVVMTGIDRVEIVSINNNNDFLSAFVISTKEYDYNEVEASALRRVLYRKLDEYIDISPYMSNTVIGRITEVKNISKLSDIIVSELPLEYNEALKYVSITNPMNRIREITLDLSKEIETVRLENEIEDNLKVKLEEEQKEYMLREKIKLIKEELGEVDLKDADIDKIRNKMNSLDLPESIIKRLNEEIDRYSLTSSASPEVTTIRTYIDWLLCLPWNKLSKDNTDVKKITEVLNNSHFGLESVKKRIIEYIAVKKKTNTSNSPIICLVGPPGVGKTSLASSIAKALNKDFVKVSLGGINDEAEILGHRRTYVGASPGKIIQQMKKANTSNPVFLIDEVDKLTKDYKGDPASALLEILDKEQNDKFCDNYIEIVKHRLYRPEEFGEKARYSGQKTIYILLYKLLQDFSIFFPFITEEIYKEIYKEAQDAYIVEEPFELHKDEDGIDFDISLTRWGPDYADPTTYLNLLLTGNSNVSWKDAIVKTVAEASKTIDYLSSVKILNQYAHITGNKMTSYFVDLDITFLIDSDRS